MNARVEMTASAFVVTCSLLLSCPAVSEELIATPVPPDCRTKHGAGLSVSLFDFYPKQGSGIESLQQATQYVAAEQPVLDLPLPEGVIDFPRGEPHGLSSVATLHQFFFGSAAESNAVPREVSSVRIRQPAGDHYVMVFRGALTVDAPGIIHLSASVDDAVEIRIGGITVYRREPLGDMLSYDDEASRFDVEFFEAGDYPVSVTFAQCEGYMGMRLMQRTAPNAADSPTWRPLRVGVPGS